MDQLNSEVQEKLQELAEIYNKYGIQLVGCMIETTPKVAESNYVPIESCGFSSN